MPRKRRPETSLGQKILKYGEVAWKKCLWIQPEELKSQSPEQLAKLKESLRRNGFATPFMVWQKS